MATYDEPSERMIVLTRLGLMPCSTGTPCASSGGQSLAHAPSQLDLPLASLSKRYSVLPLASVTMSPIFAVASAISVTLESVGAALAASPPGCPALSPPGAPGAAGTSTPPPGRGTSTGGGAWSPAASLGF